MDLTGLGAAAAIALAAIFALAAAAKLRHRALTARQFDALGLPAPTLLSVLVPVVESAIAIGLLVRPALAAIAALVTLAFFTTFLIGRIGSGSQAPCACFGAARRDPVSWVDVIRNFALAGLAALALATPTMRRPGPVEVIAIVGLVLVGFLALGRMRARRASRSATPTDP